MAGKILVGITESAAGLRGDPVADMFVGLVMKTPLGKWTGGRIMISLKVELSKEVVGGLVAAPGGGGGRWVLVYWRQ